MLKNIKSLIIFKKIFKYLQDYRLLKSIKYTKFIQNKLNISLYNYKVYSGKYIEYDINGKGKEYNENGFLIFEGEYLNGKRNGKGKEYDFDGYLLFEGEYLNGKKWNGKIFDKKKNENELKEGKGFIKEYYDNGKLKFEGEYINGKKKRRLS